MSVFLFALLAAALIASPVRAHAQNYYGQTITCSSDDGGRHYCNANTGNGVQLTRQISGSACTQGQTWGWDGNGIWVDRGCRAEFTTGAGGYGGGGYGNSGYGNAQTITCSSDDGGRHYCNANTGNGVQLTRQISGTQCIQGQTWGWDGNGIWVDRGCRAEFTTGGGNSGGGFWNGGNWGGGNSSGQTITCSSDDGKRHTCRANIRGGVQLTRQISGTQCIQGQTWGWNNRGIWVDRGCRAEFTTGRSGNWGGGNWSGSGQTITCSSDDNNRHYCNANTSGGVQLSRQISGSQCIQGQTWGWDGRGIWVDRGCRAEFITGRGNSGGGFWNGGGNPGSGTTFTCSSDDGSRKYCNANTSGGVQLTRQISGTQCIQGQTWGWDGNGVWVDRGCRAEFRTNR